MSSMYEDFDLKTLFEEGRSPFYNTYTGSYRFNDYALRAFKTKKGLDGLNKARIGTYSLLTFSESKKVLSGVTDLIGYGADPNGLDDNTLVSLSISGVGLSLLCYARGVGVSSLIEYRGSDPNTKILITYGADGEPKDWFYPLHYFLHREDYDSALALLKKIKKLPETTADRGFLRFINPTLPSAWPVFKKLCEMGCKDTPYSETLLSKACQGASITSIRIVDYLCLSKHKQNYGPGEGADMELLQEYRVGLEYPHNRRKNMTVREYAILIGAHAHLYALNQISKVALREESIGSSLFEDTFNSAVLRADYKQVANLYPVGPTIEEKVNQAIEACAFAFEDAQNPLLAEALVAKFSPQIEGDVQETLFPTLTRLDMTQFALVSPRSDLARWLIERDFCDFSRISINMTFYLNKFIEYETFERMLLKNMEYVREGKIDRALGPTLLEDVEILIQSERYDLVFLLLKYRKISKIELKKEGRNNGLFFTNEAGEEMWIEAKEIDDEYGRYEEDPNDPDITWEKMILALKKSEEYFNSANNLNWFQTNFGWWAKRASNGARTTLPPLVMALVYQYALKSSKNKTVEETEEEEEDDDD